MQLENEKNLNVSLFWMSIYWISVIDNVNIDDVNNSGDPLFTIMINQILMSLVLVCFLRICFDSALRKEFAKREPWVKSMGFA